MVKVGLDGAGGFLKVCINILVIDDDGQPCNKAKKFSYSQGVYSQGFEQGGVKRLIIIAMVQQVTENYDNLKIVLDLCGIPDLQFVQAMDIKCINTACGLGTPASTCPCPYCNLPKKDFLNLEQAKSGELRTFGTIRERASQYQKASMGCTRVSGKISKVLRSSCSVSW